MNGVLMFAGGGILLAAVLGGPDARGFRLLLVAGVALLAVGVFSGTKNPGGSDCRTEWDGRSNSTVCD